jgi:hypothetical protein
LERCDGPTLAQRGEDVVAQVRRQLRNS